MVRRKNVIGKQLRKIRTSQNLSQGELAARAQRLGFDISRDTIAKIEAQTRWVGDFELVLLAKCLAIEASDLIPKSPDISEILRWTQR